MLYVRCEGLERVDASSRDRFPLNTPEIVEHRHSVVHIPSERNYICQIIGIHSETAVGRGAVGDQLEIGF
jgi:hypothetical protein